MKQLGGNGLLWLKRWLERLKEKKGVTLIELLAVVVILAIIAAVAVPTVMGQISKSKIAADQSTESVIVDALTRAEFDYQSSSSSSGVVYLSSVGGNGTPKKGYLLNTTTADDAQVTIGNSATPENVTDLLVNGTGLSDNSSFLSSITKPNTGSDWAISSTNTTNNTVPATSFNFPEASNGSSGTFFLYPVG